MKCPKCGGKLLAVFSIGGEEWYPVNDDATVDYDSEEWDEEVTSREFSHLECGQQHEWPATFDGVFFVVPKGGDDES